MRSTVFPAQDRSAAHRQGTAGPGALSPDRLLFLLVGAVSVDFPFLKNLFTPVLFHV